MPTPPITDDQELLDRLDERLAPYAHTFMGRYANHAPMALEAMVALGRADRAEAYVAEWIDELDPIDPDGEYAALVARLRPAVDADWRGAVAAVAAESSADGFAHIGHGVIRVGHAVRALQARDGEPRRAELARALAAWAAWSEPGPLPPAAAPAAELVGALARRAMAGYAAASGRDAFFRLHTVTTSVAVGRVTAVLEPGLAAAVATAFLETMAGEIASTPIDAEPALVPYDLDPLVDAAVATGDAHHIKLVDALVFPPPGVGPTDPSRDAAIERFAVSLGVELARRPTGGTS